jgi:hypothetical protein
MLTKYDAVHASRFHHVSMTQASGTQCMRVRRNGATQTWKTRPDEFRIPVKWGLKVYYQIFDTEAAEWNVADELDHCVRCGSNGTLPGESLAHAEMVRTRANRRRLSEPWENSTDAMKVTF